MEPVYERIQKYYHDLSDTEQLAIDFILRYDDLGQLKLKIIQEDLHISAPTVVRAVKKLGFQTFNEFKYSLINLRANKSVIEESSFEQILLTLSQDFNKTIQMINEEEIMKIVSAIMDSRRIFCLGIGSSAGVAQSFNQRLKNSGVWSNDYCDIFPIKDLPEIVSNEDCLIIFSLNGSEHSINVAVSACRSKGCKIIAITGFSNSPLFALSDICMMTHQSVSKRKRLRSRLMLYVASEVIFETLMLYLN